VAEPKLFRLNMADLSRQIAPYTIGLAKLDIENGIEDAVCVGSGTLVSIGSTHGILTAAHVLGELPAKGEIGIVEYLGEPPQYRKPIIKMDYVERLKISADEFGPDKPDLGFLRLTQNDIGTLGASGSFYNLVKRKEEILSPKKPDLNFIDVISGMVDELTKDAERERTGIRFKKFSAIFCNGRSIAKRDADEYDYIDFEPTPTPEFKLPSNYGGVSGGGLWRICFVEEDSKIVIKKNWLYGIPFYQNESRDKIICHGPKSIYSKLIDAIQEKWPDVSSKPSSA